MLQVDYSEISGDLKSALDDLLRAVTPERADSWMPFVQAIRQACDNNQERFGRFFLFEMPDAHILNVHALEDGAVLVISINLEELKDRLAGARRSPYTPGGLLQ